MVSLGLDGMGTGWVQTASVGDARILVRELHNCVFHGRRLQARVRMLRVTEGTAGEENLMRLSLAARRERFRYAGLQEQSVNGAPTARIPIGLTAWPSIGDMRRRLRDLGAPIWGTKSVCWQRLPDYERVSAGEQALRRCSRPRLAGWRSKYSGAGPAAADGSD